VIFGNSCAEEIVTPVKLRLVCDLTIKYTSLSPKGSYEEVDLISDEIIEVKVSHLYSTPEKRFLSVDAMQTPLIRYSTLPLFNPANYCSIDYQSCAATFNENEIYASLSSKKPKGFNDYSADLMNIKIDRATGRLTSFQYSNISKKSVVRYDISGFCKKAPLERFF
jgi:hypothetical protein